jgi:ATP-dependent Clp protease protease subunit
MMERDYFMTSEEALSFGLIDKVLEKRSPGKGPEL